MNKNVRAIDKRASNKVSDFLKKFGQNAFQMTLKIKGEEIGLNLLEDLLLAEQVENPHAINRALDRQPAMKVYWQSLLVQAKDELFDLKRAYDIMRAYAREWVQKELTKTFASRPTRDDIESRILLIFDKYDSLKQAEKAKGEDVYYRKLLKKYVKTKKRYRDLQRSVALLEVVVEAWSARGYNLSSIANLVNGMMQMQILVVKDKRIIQRNGEIRGQKEGRSIAR